MNLFLVEDEQWALAELKTLFKRYEPQHRVLAFENGEAALEAAKTIVPHLVLTDITMPGIDGVELLAALGRQHPEAKGIILSVHDDFGYAQRGMQTGVTDYLLKPVRKETLYKAVDRMLTRIEEESRGRSDRTQWSLLQRLLSADEIEHGKQQAAAEPQRMLMVLLLLENWASPNTWGDAGVEASSLLAHFGSSLKGEPELVIASRSTAAAEYCCCRRIMEDVCNRSRQGFNRSSSRRWPAAFSFM